MPFQTIVVANPSPYERSDFVEIDDLSALGVPPDLDEGNLRLMRLWENGSSEEVDAQIDYPFGKKARYRSLTFFSRNTPPGDEHYTRPTARFSLEQEKPRDSRDLNLKIEHYSDPEVCEEKWDPARDIKGVKLSNGIAPPNPRRDDLSGIQPYFSLVSRRDPNCGYNYSGAATSILHHRQWKETWTGDILAPHDPPSDHAAEKRWGQVTRLDLYPLPWERRFYQKVFLVGQEGRSEPRYTLAWSKAGPVRATVSLKSDPFPVRYESAPYFGSQNVELACHLYRIISLYPNKEYYTEQLIVRPEGGDLNPRKRISLGFRAHYYSYLDYSDGVPMGLSRFEHIPDYFTVWRSFAWHHRGYAFASDSHVRELRATPSEIRWRLQLGHEHRCIHLFPFHVIGEEPPQPFNAIGTGWYARLLKPLQALPLNRYVMM